MSTQEKIIQLTEMIRVNNIALIKQVLTLPAEDQHEFIYKAYKLIERQKEILSALNKKA